MGLVLQSVLTMALPVGAALADLRYDKPVAERHHGHHDTYIVSRSLLSSLALAMAFLGVLGPVLCWLCVRGVFDADGEVVLSYFTALTLTAFVLWALARSYRVVTYQDHLTVRPLLGRTRSIAYDQIERMEWAPSVLRPHIPNVRVWKDGRVACRLWGAVDIDQILLRVDRFDAFGQDGGGR